jgi:energy-converting hydrogenase Eha subunit F
MYSASVVDKATVDCKCHDPNPGSITGNAGAVLKGHLTYVKPQNRYIKGTIYSKIRSISQSSEILYYSKLMKPKDSLKLLISN